MPNSPQPALIEIAFNELPPVLCLHYVEHDDAIALKIIQRDVIKRGWAWAGIVYVVREQQGNHYYYPCPEEYTKCAQSTVNSIQGVKV